MIWPNFDWVIVILRFCCDCAFTTVPSEYWTWKEVISIGSGSSLNTLSSLLAIDYSINFRPVFLWKVKDSCLWKVHLSVYLALKVESRTSSWNTQSDDTTKSQMSLHLLVLNIEWSEYTRTVQVQSLTCSLVVKCSRCSDSPESELSFILLVWESPARRLHMRRTFRLSAVGQLHKCTNINLLTSKYSLTYLESRQKGQESEIFHILKRSVFENNNTKSSTGSTCFGMDVCLASGWRQSSVVTPPNARN